MKHLVLRNGQLHGMEYGMLRDFEDEISKITGAQIMTIPMSKRSLFLDRKFARGTRYALLRQSLPQQELSIDADVVWVILMGPENFSLDLFKHWSGKPRTKYILYLFDTLESQFDSIRQIVHGWKWDLMITSFNDALPLLEEYTGMKWTCVPQGVAEGRFKPAPARERVMSFSSYGRRIDNLHQAIKNFTTANGLYYDFTTWSGVAKSIDPREFYAQYAWHLSHSVFTIGLPVEVTHPTRAGNLRPITCRWFEAMAAGTPIVGAVPENPEFEKILLSNFHVKIDFQAPIKAIQSQLSEIWDAREEICKAHAKAIEGKIESHLWSVRVQQILDKLQIT